MFELTKPGVMSVDVTTDQEDNYTHINQPKPSETALYGLIGDFGRIAAKNTEVNPFAAAMGLISFLSANTGRDVYFPIGNTFHHARVFSLHVGRSSKGRKGDSLSLVRRIQKAIDPELIGQLHSGGLSTREGLIMLIHDGYTTGSVKNQIEVPAIADKRLWIIESEFANVLQQTKRDGNTLSAALRDGWDGISIAPATKTNRMSATDPHITAHGNITPSELISLIQSRELSNGFANRFIIFWAERFRLVPFPEASPDEVVLRLARRIEDVIGFAKGKYPEVNNSRCMAMTSDARKLYEDLYLKELNHADGGEIITSLLDRRAPTLIRLAMLFALTDKTLLIDTPHIEAAAAWIRYWTESVKFIFKDFSLNQNEIDQQMEVSNKIVEFLIDKPDGASKTEIITECFSRHLAAAKINSAIDFLLSESPPKIEAIEKKRADGKVGRGSKHFRIFNTNTSSEVCEVRHHALSSPNEHDCEFGEFNSLPDGSVTLTSQSSPNFESAPTFDTSVTSQNSQNSQVSNKTIKVRV